MSGLGVVEFTDRYGGNAPSWLQGCLGGCQATGVVPAEPEWLTCSKCNGTGRVGFAVSISRIPRWIWKGIKFMRHAFDAKMHPPTWSLWKRIKMCAWSTWGYDLWRLRL